MRSIAGAFIFAVSVYVLAQMRMSGLELWAEVLARTGVASEKPLSYGLEMAFLFGSALFGLAVVVLPDWRPPSRAVDLDEPGLRRDGDAGHGTSPDVREQGVD